MVTDLIKYFNEKKILILGFGTEGQSTYRFIRKHLPNQTLYIADQKENFQNHFIQLKQDKKLKCISGKKYLNNIDKYDIIIKTPGIAFTGVDISKFENKLKSELELLLEFFQNRIIGVSGTKGKSTTSSLIYKMLKDQNINTLLLGNIGIPVFDFIDEIQEDTTIVLEMSSHQLEFMKTSPNISILTNLFPEHLDHYNSYDEYAKAKCNIFKNQKPEDFFIYNYDNKDLRKYVNTTNLNTLKVSINGDESADIKLVGDKVLYKEKIIYDKKEQRNLIGDFNLNNIMFVLGVSEILGLDLNKTIKSISEFKTLPHRLEFVAEVDGVKYYDNSIATVFNATIEAVKALEEVDTLIIGGMDRGLDYSEFVKFLDESDITNVICMPKTGHDIAKQMQTNKCYIVETLEEAVHTAKTVTAKGKICLLAPAAASYGFFKNFEEKGDLYKKLLQEN